MYEGFTLGAPVNTDAIVVIGSKPRPELKIGSVHP
jgi:hypothetical protein